MATIDNINTYLTNLQTSKTDIAAAITEKGVTVPSGTKYAGFAPLIDQIQVASNGSKWTQSNIDDICLHAYYKNGAWYGLPIDDFVVVKSADGKSWTWPDISNTNTTYLGAVRGRTPVWIKHYYYEDDEGLSRGTEEVTGYTPTETVLAISTSSNAWNTAITGSTTSAIPCFCSDIIIDDISGGLVLVRPAGNIMELTSGDIGSNLKWAWKVYRKDYPYAYDAVGGRMFTTDSTCTRLSQITGATANFDAYPECGLHTDGYYYIRRCLEYSNGLVVVKALRDHTMGKFGLQYSTNGGSTWLDSNVINSTNNASYKFNCVYYANGKCVAGGPLGIYHSDDGKTWTKAEGFTGTCYSVYYYGGIWVAATNDGLYYSV